MATRSCGVIALAAVAVLGTTPAFASVQIYVSGAQMGPYESTTISGGLVGGSQTEGYTGEQIETANLGTSYQTPTFSLQTWCVDLNHYIYLGSDSIVYTLGNLSQINSSPSVTLTSAQKTYVTWLGSYGTQQLNNWTPADATAYGSQNTFSAAIQTAIWNAEYGSTYTGSDSQLAADLGEFSATFSQIPNPAATFIGIPVVLLSYPASNQYQELLTFLVPGSGGTAGTLAQQYASSVPEPASAALLAGGLFVAGYLRRRRSV